MTSYLRTPGQTTSAYGLGTPNAARPRGLFFVRFRKANIQGSDTTNQNRQSENRGNEFGFVVKSLDQPKISIKTEEISQYNKKRQVHTGYDVSPITITLIDTMNGVARVLWQDYLRHHFGDFSHNPDALDWQPDQLTPEMNGGMYGLVLPETDIEADRYFFHTIEIIQVYQAVFTKTILVNPRILSFDPDDLDYEQMTPSSFRMQVTYETVLFEESRSLRNDPELLDLFGHPSLEGNPIDLPNVEPPVSDWVLQEAPFGFGDGAGSFVNNAFRLGGINIPNILGGLVKGGTTGAGGVLGSLGSLNFGNMAGVAVERLIGGGRRGNLASEIVYAGTNNAALAGIVQVAEGRNATANLISTGVSLLQRSNPSANPVVFDAARALIASKTGNKQGAGNMAARVVKGLLTATAATGVAPSGHVQRSGSGMSLSNEGLASVNSKQPARAKIGVRTPRKG
jgi:hypothetical protein